MSREVQPGGISGRFLSCLLFFALLPMIAWAQPAQLIHWQRQDIGAVEAAGSDHQFGDVTMVRGSGEDIAGLADEFHFTYQSWNGDGVFVARITHLDNTHDWAKAGLMIRE